MSKPDYIYDPDNWDMTYRWDRRNDLMDGFYPMKEPVLFATLIEGPTVYAVDVVLTLDKDGNPDETEIQWFDNKEDADKAAHAAMMAEKDTGE